MKDFLKISFEKIAFYLKIFLSFWKIFVAKGIWVEKVLEKFSTQLQIELGNVFDKFYFHLSSNRVKIVFYKDFIFLKFKVFFSCSKRILHGNWEKECVTNRFYFLKPQAFLFLIKIVFHGYLRQIAKQFWCIGFHKNKKSMSFIEKRKPNL